MRFNRIDLNIIAAAATCCIVTTVDAIMSLDADELNKIIRSGKVDTKSLLKSAIPYRHLENYDNQKLNGYLQGQDITGDMSVNFHSCVALSVQEFANEDIITYAKDYLVDGTISPVQSYVLFNVCTTSKDCIYEQDNVDNTYIVELKTWVNAMISYVPNMKDGFCEGCWKHAEYCLSAVSSTASAGVDIDDAYSMYNDAKYQLIDCDQCYSFQCYSDVDAYEQNNWGSVSEWMYEISECSETGSYWQNLDLYASWMCNADGSGMEIAIFVDEDCTWYNSLKSYSRLLQYGAQEWEYYSKSIDIVSYIFSNRFDCYGGNTNYINLWQETYIEQGSYDPCAYDYNTGSVLDYDECYALASENPCYNGIGSGQYDGGNGDNDDYDYREAQCAEYMESYPCWTMPGQALSKNYTDACYEYQLANPPPAVDSCTSLFENDLPSALSDCSYIKSQQNNDNDNYYNNDNAWDSNLYYDIYYNDADDWSAICSYVKGVYRGRTRPVADGYNHESSGTLYEYGVYNRDVGGYFPVVNSASPRRHRPKKVLLHLLLVIGILAVLIFAANKIRLAYRRVKDKMARKALRRQQKDVVNDSRYIGSDQDGKFITSWSA